MRVNRFTSSLWKKFITRGIAFQIRNKSHDSLHMVVFFYIAVGLLSKYTYKISKYRAIKMQFKMFSTHRALKVLPSQWNVCAYMAKRNKSWKAVIGRRRFSIRILTAASLGPLHRKWLEHEPEEFTRCFFIKDIKNLLSILFYVWQVTHLT